MHLAMIFADGFGLGSKENNPLVLARTPYLDKLLGGHLLWGDRDIKYGNCRLYSLDATLGVPGLPQSATGQTTLWTGVNAPGLLGYHLNAYPNEKLIGVINKHSIFKQLSEKGKKVMFANAFTQNYEQLIQSGKRKHSTSTLSAQAGGVRLRRRADLLAGKAVYQDVTNEIYREKGEDVPLYQPLAAGRNLAGISRAYDFVLFEYFQTDVRGHKRNLEASVKVIEILDEFLGGYLSVIEALPPDQEKMALLLTSDHGNIEDLTTSLHTRNKVPALCWSNFGLEWPVMTSIADVTPTIVELLAST